MPCQFQKISQSVISDLFQNSLPSYIQDMRNKWGEIRCTKVSGLAPTSEGGPLDDCIRSGAWIPEQQLAHGGPIPFLSGSAGSRGVKQQWPYHQASTASWSNVGHGIYHKSALHTAATGGKWGNSLYGNDFHNMDWTVGRRRIEATKHGDLIKPWLDEAGRRRRPWRPHKGRAGAKRHRSGKQDEQGIQVAVPSKTENLNFLCQHYLVQ